MFPVPPPTASKSRVAPPRVRAPAPPPAGLWRFPALPAVRLPGWVALAGLFLTIFGARLWLIARYGSAMPVMDQWPAEGWLLFKPWIEGKLHWADLFIPHLEHRIFFTRVLALGLLRANGQWDAQLEAVVNAALCAGVAVAVAAVLGRAFGGVGRGWRAGVGVGLAGIFSLPFAWENTLGGFQSQFYFLLGFSLLALWGLGTRRAFSPAWWAGAGGALAACFSMGSGLLASAVVPGWLAVWILRERRWPRGGELATLGICAAVLALGWTLRNEVAAHAVLKVESPAAWLVAWGRCAAWPRVARPGWGPLMFLPLALLAWRFLSGRQPRGSGRAAELLLLAGGWVLLQEAAMAYARGGQGLPPPPRYMDLLAFGALVNALALWLLAADTAPGPRRNRARLGAAAWTLFLLAGLGARAAGDFNQVLPAARETLRTQERNVRAYVADHDRRRTAALAFPALPYPVSVHLMEYLDDPSLRPLLPAVVREPLRMTTPPEAAGPFAPGALPESLRRVEAEAAARGESLPPAWGSYGPHGAADQGRLRARLEPAARLPWLQMEFAGALGGPAVGLSLALENSGGGERATALRPVSAAGGRWHREIVRAPGGGAGELSLVAEDANPAAWFGWRAPVEMGEWSRWADWLARRGGWVFWAGALGLAVGLLVPARVGGRKGEASGPSQTWSGVARALAARLARLAAAGKARVPRRGPRSVWMLAAGAGFAWLLLLRLVVVPTLAAGEPVWVPVLTEAVARPWQFGREFVFTYGPAAPMVMSAYSAEIFNVTFAAWLLRHGFHVGLAVWLGRTRLAGWRRWGFWLVAFAAVLPDLVVADLLSISFAALALSSRRGRAAERWGLGVPALGFAVLLSLAKGSYGCYAVVCLGIVALGWLAAGRPGRALGIAALGAGWLAVFWRGLGQEFGNLPAFVRGNWEITTGYPQAMGLSPRPAVLALSLGVLALSVAQAGWLWRRTGAAGLPRLFLVLGGLWIAWKSGFTRADDHVLDFLLFAAPMALAMPAFFADLGGSGEEQSTYAPARRWMPAATAAVVALTLLTIFWQRPDMDQVWTSTFRLNWSHNARWLLHPRELAAGAEAQLAGERRKNLLPRVRAAVGRDSVDVLGAEQTIALLNELNYAPAPVALPYNAWTAYLTGLNGEFYRDEARAPRFVLFKLQTLDGRVPTLENAPALLALIHGYEPVLAENGFVLWRRRAADAGRPALGLADLGAPVASGTLAPGEALAIPTVAPGEALWCELDARENLAGRLRSFLYQPCRLRLELTDARSGRTASHRLVPDLARSGFLLSPTLGNERDFLRLVAGEEIETPGALRVVTENPVDAGRFLSPRIAYRFFRVPPVNDVAVADAARRVEDERWAGPPLEPALVPFADLLPTRPTRFQLPAPPRRFTNGGRGFVLAHPVSEVRFAVPAGAGRARGRFALEPGAFQEHTTDGVEFRVEFAFAPGDAGQPTVTLLDRTLVPRAEPGRDGGPQEFDVLLPAGSRGGELILRTLPGPAGDTAFDWAGWADVRFEPR